MQMKLRIKKWGSSAVIRLPASLLGHINAEVGSTVNVKLIAGGRVLIAPAKPRYLLEDLLAEMPDQFPVISAWDDMKPVGNEII